MALTAIVTNAGRAALVNASNTGTAPVTITQVGLTATAVVPGAGITVLPGEYKRVATISGDVVADDTIHLIVRDESADVFTLRSFALYLADGTLFAIYGQAGVILEKSAQAMMLLAIDVQFADVAAAALTFGDTNFLNPPATTERQGVVELATVAEAQAGIDALRALTPAAAKAAILGWLLGQDGSGSGLDADLLDGQDGSYYSNIPARLGYSPVQQGTGLGQGTNTIKIGWSGSRIKATVDTTDQGNIATDNWLGSGGLDINGAYMRRNGYHLFGPDNDGAGSGLDADLLDGQDGSYYSNITARLGYTPVNRAGDTMSGALALPSINLAGGAGTNGLAGGNGDGASYSLYNLLVNAHYGVGFKTYDGSVNGFYDARAGRWDVKAGYRINGVDVWHPTNDGSGSGLDADLLDGQQGGFYTDIVGRLGFTPVRQGGGAGQGGNLVFIGWSGTRMKLQVDNLDLGPLVTDAWLASGGLSITGYTMYRGNYSLWGPDNDGAGSGLDADLLDGQDGGYYSNIVARLGYTPVNKAGDTMTGPLSFQAAGTNGFQGGNGDGASYSLYNLRMNCWYGLGIVTYDGSVNGFYDARAGRWDVKAGYRINGTDVWHPGNDGSGSGLDADLLDGYQGSDYDRVVAQSLVENGGYIVYASGRKECWGVVNIVTEDAYVTVNLPTQHDSWVLPIGDGMALASTAQENTAVRDIQYDGSGRPISFRIYNAAGPLGGFPFRWRSIGK